MFSGVLEEAKFYGFNSMIGHLEEYIEVSFFSITYLYTMPISY